VRVLVALPRGIVVVEDRRPTVEANFLA